MVEVIKSDRGLAGAGVEGEEFVQVVADLFEGKIRLALFPEGGEAIGKQAEGRGGAGVIAARQDGGAAAQRVLHDAQFSLAGGGRSLRSEERRVRNKRR